MRELERWGQGGHIACDWNPKDLNSRLQTQRRPGIVCSRSRMTTAAGCSGTFAVLPVSLIALFRQVSVVILVTASLVGLWESKLP